MPMKILSYLGKRMELSGTVVLGRHRKNQIKIDDPAASRRHARIELRDDGPWLVDLGSANGTRVNGTRVAGERRLEQGDRIQIGEREVIYDLAEVAVGADGRRRLSAASPGRDAEDGGDTGRAAAPAVARLDDLIGRDFAGHRIHRMLSQDACSALFLARQADLDRRVALRIFRREVMARCEQAADLALEQARRVGRLSHRHLGIIHECGTTDGLAWCSMEYLEGRNLGQVIAEDGPLAPETALLVLEEVARALAVAHADHLVHGDIRPESIIVGPDGTARLANFGTAPVQCALQAAQGRGACAGSPLYCAPEFATSATLDVKTDLYSLGCTFFCMLVGEPPFTGATPEAILRRHREDPIPDPADRRPGLPGACNKLLHGLLDKNLDWRYASVRELLDELEVLRPTIGPAAAPPAARPAPRLRSGRLNTATRPTEAGTAGRARRRLVALVAAAVVLVAVIAAVPFIRHALVGASVPVTPGGVPTGRPRVPEDPDWAAHGPRLAFNDPGELSHLECTLGEPALVDGHLTGSTADPVLLRCDHPFGGLDWTVRFTVRCPEREGQERGFSLDISEGPTPLVILAIEGGMLTTTIRKPDGIEDVTTVALSPADLAVLPVAIRCRDGMVSISLAGQVHLPDTPLRPATAARVGISGKGTTWQLDDLKIYGRTPPTGG